MSDESLVEQLRFHGARPDLHGAASVTMREAADRLGTLEQELAQEKAAARNVAICASDQASEQWTRTKTAESSLAACQRELAEAHAFLTGKGETGYCMTHPSGQPNTELGKAAQRLKLRAEAAEAERDRLRQALKDIAQPMMQGGTTTAWACQASLCEHLAEAALAEDDESRERATGAAIAYRGALAKLKAEETSLSPHETP